jgi:hypothetical protein
MRAVLTPVLILMLMLLETSCFWSRKRTPSGGVRQTPQQRPKSPKKSSVSRRPAAKSKSSKQVRRNPPAENKPAPQAAPAPKAPPPPPTFAQVLTAEERRQLSITVDTRLTSARRDLESVTNAALTPDQAESVRTIRSFIARAEKARDADPELAAQLAYRAEVLASSLVVSVRE